MKLSKLFNLRDLLKSDIEKEIEAAEDDATTDPALNEYGNHIPPEGMLAPDPSFPGGWARHMPDGTITRDDNYAAQAGNSMFVKDRKEMMKKSGLSNHPDRPPNPMHARQALFTPEEQQTMLSRNFDREVKQSLRLKGEREIGLNEEI